MADYRHESPVIYGRGLDPVAQLILNRGEIAAEGARRTGGIIAGTLSDLGQVLQERKAADLQRKRQAAVNQVISTWDGQDPQRLFMGLAGVVGPQPAAEIAKTVVELKRGPVHSAPTTREVRQPDGSVKTLQWDAQAGTWGDAPGVPVSAPPARPAENPEVVVVDGQETMATPSEIAALKAKGAKVTGYHAPPHEMPTSLEQQIGAASLAGDQDTVNKLLKAKAAVAAAGRPPSEPRPDTSSELDAHVEALLGGTPASSVPIKFRTAAIVEARKRGGRVFNSATEKDKVNNFESIKVDVDRAVELLNDPEVTSYLGKFQGPIASSLKEYPIIGSQIPAKAREFLTLAEDLNDRRLRQRSGAAINKDEAARITRFSLGTNLSVATLRNNAAKLQRELDGQIKGYTGTPTSQEASRPATRGDVASFLHRHRGAR